MKDYNELLKDDRWKKKRLEILVRDNHTCQRCGTNNNNPLDTKIQEVTSNYHSFEYFYYKGMTQRLIKLKIFKLEIVLKTDTLNFNLKNKNEFYLLINFADKNFIEYPFRGSTTEKFNSNVFFPYSTNKFLYDRLDKIQKKENIFVDKESLWLVEKENILDYLKNSKSLHVHHKCYRTNYEIWDQPNNEYVTLCNTCHQIVHTNQLIPYYDEMGRIIQLLECCDRCNGKKILKCYKHIQNGICFKCNGKGFLEKHYNERLSDTL